MEKRQNVNQKIEAINLLELEMNARELLSQTAYDYYASGAKDEVTLREDRLAYERITLLPRNVGRCGAKAHEHDRAG
jgi:4-hydroxymandelate oxidase